MVSNTIYDNQLHLGKFACTSKELKRLACYYPRTLHFWYANVEFYKRQYHCQTHLQSVRSYTMFRNFNWILCLRHQFLTNYKERKPWDAKYHLDPFALRAATSKDSKVIMGILIHHQRQRIKEDGHQKKIDIFYTTRQIFSVIMGGHWNHIISKQITDEEDTKWQ